jgi:ADP-ribosylglycohydrolase
MDELPDLLRDLLAPRRDAALEDRVHGCLAGGFAGDVLGAPVEFLSWREIRQVHGDLGVTAPLEDPLRLQHATDDTQMTLFTLDGVVRALLAGEFPEPDATRLHLARAYHRWLTTQDEEPVPSAPDARAAGWLAAHPALRIRRAPGLTCLHALSSLRDPADCAVNDSKGCGTVMRVAPVALACALFGGGARRPEVAFALGCESAVISHGHPTARHAAGALAVVLIGLLHGKPLERAVECAQGQLAAEPHAHETQHALAAALASRRADPDAVHALGAGWTAEEALAIAVRCVHAHPDAADAVRAAVNHGGDSDSTGAIAGQLAGARGGLAAFPASWTRDADGVLAQAVADLVAAARGGETRTVRERYPLA